MRAVVAALPRARVVVDVTVLPAASEWLSFEPALAAVARSHPPRRNRPEQRVRLLSQEGGIL